MPTFGAVRYEDLYDGIDLRYDGTDGRLKGSWHLAPGADPAAIRWRYVNGGPVRLDHAGNLVLAVPSGGPADGERTMVEAAPTAWQEQGERRQAIAVTYGLAADAHHQAAADVCADLHQRPADGHAGAAGAPPTRRLAVELCTAPRVPKSARQHLGQPHRAG